MTIPKWDPLCSPSERKKRLPGRPFKRERRKVWNLKTGITGLPSHVIIPRRKLNIWKPASFHECWHFLSPEELLITHPSRPSKKMTWAELYCVTSIVQAKALGTWVLCGVRRNTKGTDGWVSSWTAPYLGQNTDNNRKHEKKEKTAFDFSNSNREINSLFLFGNQKNIQVLIHH